MLKDRGSANTANLAHDRLELDHKVPCVRKICE